MIDKPVKFNQKGGNMEDFDFTIENSGPRTIPSPLVRGHTSRDRLPFYSLDHMVTPFLSDHYPDRLAKSGEMHLRVDKQHLLEVAGPREYIYFEPSQVKVGIVTCGGLCPGLNVVIRSIVMSMHYNYGVKDILGIRNGYRGFLPEFNYDPIPLDPDIVGDIHTKGGTILGSSRGHGHRTAEIVDTILNWKLNILFTIGGDGTQHSAHEIANELKRRNANCVVVGVPKTIDNDISFVEKSFGFETAVSIAVDSISAAHTEARDSINGIGLVKLMGRQSGFIAAHATLAMSDVNIVLVPEIPFKLHGPTGLLPYLESRLKRRGHAVVVVAEGAGQHLLSATNQRDASGNTVLADIGKFLNDCIKDHFASINTEINLKYIDPSYLIRSSAANPIDSIYCNRLGANATHAAMAGKTNCIVSLVRNQYVYVPIKMAIKNRNSINPRGPLWRDVITSTGQPE